ncbi:MAG: chemotaxis protein CheA, partial [Gammaproteobacteria bacterium]
LVGEVVIAGANTNLLAHRAGLPELVASSATLARLVDEVRDNALGLRMVPIGGTFNRFHRVVRDVGRELGKDIDLVLNGGDTELDKTMVERLGDPLMHLVRNAMDHGIEATAERRARGKSPRGCLTLNARHDAGSIVIEVCDDGGGLDRERVLEKAIERGLVAPGQALSDQEVWQLVFEPGFSTAQAITSVSGRGVGMDVVKSNVTAMRGTIDIDSEPGRGTTVRLHLPLTLAIIDGFLVKAGPTPCVIPLDMVRECIELGADERSALRDSGYLNLRGEVLPLLRLRDQFGAHDDIERRETVVVVRAAGRDAGLVVDELLGESQTVIKPLGRLFRHLDGISGSTILGSGDVALILDVPGLIQRVTDALPRAAGAPLH